MSPQKVNKVGKQKAGVVVGRQFAAGEELKILLITARVDPASWIFPVGKVDDGETLAQAATRECREESGVVVEVDAFLKDLDIQQFDGATRRFTYFIANYISETNEYETDRHRKWVSLSTLENQVADVFRPVAQAAIQYYGH
jgi:8-oxo-dGTP pyrophosphatase MutT (NUDIX family)